MIRIGCHLSSSKGYLAMAKEAYRIGADTCQYFSRNPRGGALKEWNQKDADDFIAFCHEKDIHRIITHAPYVLNLSAKDPDLRKYSLNTMIEDVKRLDYFEDAFYNFHPGAHVSQGAEVGIELIAEGVNRLIHETDRTMILLETMAGKGTEMARSFDEIKAIISLIENPSRIGVCMDTCHIFDGGYDIVNHPEEVLDEFDEKIGLNKLYGVHLNDSKNPLGSHKDRHELIGDGHIGSEAVKRILKNPRMDGLPFVLETPNDVPGYQKEIAYLRQLYES